LNSDPLPLNVAYVSYLFHKILAKIAIKKELPYQCATVRQYDKDKIGIQEKLFV
jgi:hypothetical protein